MLLQAVMPMYSSQSTFSAPTLSRLWQFFASVLQAIAGLSVRCQSSVAAEVGIHTGCAGQRTPCDPTGEIEVSAIELMAPDAIPDDEAADYEELADVLARIIRRMVCSSAPSQAK